MSSLALSLAIRTSFSNSKLRGRGFLRDAAIRRSYTPLLLHISVGKEIVQCAYDQRAIWSVCNLRGD